MKNLAVARAGDDSKHDGWLSDPSKKNFDLLVGDYSSEPGRWSKRADFYHWEKGLKYPWFHRYLQANPWVFEYDAVWLADDDIEAGTETVSDMFDIFHEWGLWLAQPALTPKSSVSFPALVRKPERLLRYFEHIEEQVPIFSRDALRRVWETFGENQSGWGLRIPWRSILKPPLEKVAVIDATPVRHCRAWKTGPMYSQVLPALGLRAEDEQKELARKYSDPGRVRSLGERLLDPSHPKTPERLDRQLKD